MTSSTFVWRRLAHLTPKKREFSEKMDKIKNLEVKPLQNAKFLKPKGKLI